ncbi:unnamed protein product, partial [Amoebophrya sp. A25]
RGVSALFPEERLLAELDLEGYDRVQEHEGTSTSASDWESAQLRYVFQEDDDSTRVRDGFFRDSSTHGKSDRQDEIPTVTTEDNNEDEVCGKPHQEGTSRTSPTSQSNTSFSDSVNSASLASSRFFDDSQNLLHEIAHVRFHQPCRRC